MTMTHNYYPWDGLINRLRACDEAIAKIEQDQADTAWGGWMTDEGDDDG